MASPSLPKETMRAWGARSDTGTSQALSRTIAPATLHRIPRLIARMRTEA